MSFHDGGESVGVATVIGMSEPGLTAERCFEFGWLVQGGEAEDLSGFGAQHPARVPPTRIG